MHKPLLALAAFLTLTAAAPALAAEDPRDQVIYLIMVDRFANGDRRNDFDVDVKNPHAYHGGDLKGVRQHLDELKDLGVTTLWLTPINDNQDLPLAGKYHGYHGYWIQQFARIDEHMGSEQDLKDLVTAAHRRGLKVILDVVDNQAGYDAAIAHDPARASWFHHNGRIVDWEDPYQNENFDLAGLPDFASENQQVLDYMERAWAGWIKRADLDGFRLDTVRHVPMAFWRRFNARMRKASKRPFYIVGEVSYHDPAKVAPYMRDGGLDSAFDFPMFGTLGQVFARGGSMRLLADRFAQDKLYDDPRLLSPFLDNHDEVRFMTAVKGDERKFKLGLACLLTMRGIPSLTWGTEVGLEGGRDPENRHDMPFGRKPELRAYTRRLIQLRRGTPALTRGSQRTLYVDDHVIVFERVAAGGRVVVALNNGDRAARAPVPLPGAWRDALNGGALDAPAAIDLAPYQARVLLPRV